MTDRPSARRPRWFRLLISLAATVAAIGLAEFTYRGWLRLRGEPYSAWRTEESMREVLRVIESGIPGAPDPSEPASGPAVEPGRGAIAAGALDIPHPYFGFEFVANVAGVGETARYFASDEAERAYDVLILGGSVAAILVEWGSAEIEARLAEQPQFSGRPIRVHGQGHGAFKQPQQVAVLSFLLSLGFRPDAVVNVDGFNEVALTMENASHGANPIFPVFTQWSPLVSTGKTEREAHAFREAARARRIAARSLFERAVRWHWTASAIGGRFAKSRLQAMLDARTEDTRRFFAGLAAEGNDPATHGPPFDAAPEKVVELSVRAWVEGSRTLRAICEARGIRYVHVLQPTLLDPNSKVLTEEEIRAGGAPATYAKGVRFGYGRLREEGERLRAAGECFVDATGLFRDVAGRVYADHCHFNGDGNRMLARTVAAAFERPASAK